jgi:hypothetical protein
MCWLQSKELSLERFCGIAFVLCLFAAATAAQEILAQVGSAGDKFTFIRIQFDAMIKGWGNDGWAHDYPDAEINFLRGVTRLSDIHINAEPAVLRLDDDRIFEFPFLYLVEFGYGRWLGTHLRCAVPDTIRQPRMQAWDQLPALCADALNSIM